MVVYQSRRFFFIWGRTTVPGIPPAGHRSISCHVESYQMPSTNSVHNVIRSLAEFGPFFQGIRPDTSVGILCKRSEVPGVRTKFCHKCYNFRACDK